MSERNPGTKLTEDGKVVTDWKFLACFAAIVASTVAGYLGIHNDIKQVHEDCAQFYRQSWHIADEVEASHQTMVANGHRPDPSEILRITRVAQSEPSEK